MGVLIWRGWDETRVLVARREVDPVAAAGAVLECTRDRIDRVVPAGASVALVETDDLLGQVLAERLTPRVTIVDRAEDADVLLTVTRHDPFDCALTAIRARAP